MQIIWVYDFINYCTALLREGAMFLLVLVICVTLEGQTICHEFEREHFYLNRNTCLIAAALDSSKYSSRMKQRKWANYKWECRPKGLT